MLQKIVENMPEFIKYEETSEKKKVEKKKKRSKYLYIGIVCIVIVPFDGRFSPSITLGLATVKL